jgi:hypothetical protein
MAAEPMSTAIPSGAMLIGPILAFTAGFAVAMLVPGCSASSACPDVPTPNPETAILFPCNLTLTHSVATGPCAFAGGGNAVSVGASGAGTCAIDLTFSNGFHYQASIAFVGSSGACSAAVTPSVSEIRIGFPLCRADGGACVAACGCVDSYDQNGGTVFVDAGVGAPDCGASTGADALAE